MSDFITMQIEIPTDNDGFTLLQCPLCGEFFKVRPSDYEDDGILELCCPACGLYGDNYFTDDVIELAEAMAHNVAMDLIHKEMKKIERNFKGGAIKLKAENKPKKQYENPICATIDVLVVTHFRCCKRESKIKQLLKICGSYCPFCGVKEFEIE